MKFFLARLLYWPSLLAILPADVLSLVFDSVVRLLSLAIGAMASSLILYCKTYDWLIVLALKRKRIDKKFGINTGLYFVFVMTISTITFVYSFICLAVFLGGAEFKAAVLTIMVILIGTYVQNLYDAYKADPEEVLNEIRRKQFDLLKL